MGRRKTVEDCEKDLHRALGRLDEHQGARGRANARKASLDALRGLRAAVDRDFPVTKKRKATGKLAPGHRANRLKARGWVNVATASASAAMSRAIGITPEPDPHQAAAWQARTKARARAKGLPAPSAPLSAASTGHVYVPKWVDLAASLGLPKSECAAAKRSPAKRRSILAQALLLAGDDELGFRAV